MRYKILALGSERMCSCLQGSVGAPGLAGPVLSEALSRRSLFVYCGHGAGQQHLQTRALRRQRACAASLLMGCSSGRLARSGQHYEPSGPILGYLLAGGPARHALGPKLGACRAEGYIMGGPVMCHALHEGHSEPCYTSPFAHI